MSMISNTSAFYRLIPQLSGWNSKKAWILKTLQIRLVIITII